MQNQNNKDGAVTAKLSHVEVMKWLEIEERILLAQYGEAELLKEEAMIVVDISNDSVCGVWHVRNIEKFAKWYVSQERFKYCAPPKRDRNWKKVG